MEKDISNSTIEEAFVEVRKCILWYQGNSEKGTIDQLQRVQDKITTWSYFIGEELSKAFGESSMSYMIRKVEVSRKKLNLMNNSGMSGTKADAQSIVDCEDQYKQEIESETYTNHVKILLDQSYKVVKAISQRISNLKNEREHAKTQT